ncbi:Type IV secretory system Conjugative DNA transfer [[Clostridium] symbiosum]|uniref:Type IV secretory system Conjugative DNA transfer n=2 Tax=Clostridium symbiosum TaxID=1512 RepID=A0A6N3BDA6_CLOSY|nr:type IV secretory system conjugative DNA transfer family protein [[Clostridium] symbiosum]ERI74580.1 TraG/TraD family protein [[Clostridium] symbiosum ATCC 14940]SUY60663.1 plasmid transfer factor-like protein [[Clostridium] symbiosum]
MNTKIKKYVVPNLPYLFIFWFFCKVGTAYRLAEGADFGAKLIGMMKTIGPAFGTITPGLAGFDLLVGLVGAVVLRLVVYNKVKNAKKFRKDVEYGSARWGTAKDIAPFVDPKFENNVILTGTEFLTMNTRPKIPANARNLNCCIIGSSGSGKTRFWLTPQLLQAHSSYVCVDPKGGVLSQVGHFLQKRKGYKFKVFNSVDFRKSMHYNPMAYIKTESDVLKFVNALITNTKGQGKEGDEFWTKAETLLYCALVAYIVFEGPEEERNMNTLVEMINSMEVREDDESFKNAVDYMFDGLAKRKPQCFAVRQYAKYRLSSGKTAKSILISCGARLAPFDIAELREIMSYDELELDRLGDEKTALFFCISDTDSTYNFIVALAFSQMFNLLCEKADNVYGGRLPHHVRVLWDEAANTGQVPQLEKMVAVIRSREISLCLFYQAMSQCKALYKDNSETILGNMDSVIFLGGREHSTIKEISEVLGKETISMYTESRTRGQSESYGQNLQRLGKELMTMDELTTMDGSKCILQLRGLRPFLSPKYDLKKHPNYKYTAEADKKRNAFRLEKLISTRLKLNPEEVYEVYGAGDADSAEDDILNYDDLDDPDAFA